MPELTVVTPVLNGSKYLGQALRSAAEQDVDLEHIIVDGGSTDGSLDLVQAYCSEYQFARYLTGKDNGQADAINRGIAAARSRVVAWLNADDTYLPGALQSACSAFRAHGDAVLVYGGARVIDCSGGVLYVPEVRPFDRSTLLRVTNFIAQPAAFFTKEAFSRVGGLDPKLHFSMDLDLWLRLSHAGQVRRLDETLASFRLHGSSKTCSRQWRFHVEHSLVARRYGADLSSPVFKRALIYLLKEPARRLAIGCGWMDPMRSFLPEAR